MFIHNIYHFLYRLNIKYYFHLKYKKYRNILEVHVGYYHFIFKPALTHNSFENYLKAMPYACHHLDKLSVVDHTNHQNPPYKFKPSRQFFLDSFSSPFSFFFCRPPNKYCLLSLLWFVSHTVVLFWSTFLIVIHKQVILYAMNYHPHFHLTKKTI